MPGQKNKAAKAKQSSTFEGEDPPGFDHNAGTAPSTPLSFAAL